MEQGGEKRERLLRAGRAHPGRDGMWRGDIGAREVEVARAPGGRAAGHRGEDKGPWWARQRFSSQPWGQGEAAGRWLLLGHRRRCLGILGEGLGLRASGVQCKCCQVHGCRTCLGKHVFSTAGRELRDHLGPSLLTERETKAQGDGTDLGGGSRPGSAPAQHVPQQVPHLQARFLSHNVELTETPTSQGFVRTG